MSVTILPTPHTQRAWIERETFRIAAGVKGATLQNLASFLYRTHRNAGLSEEAAQLDVARTIAHVEARLDQYCAILSAPPPMNGRPSCAKG